MWGDPENEIITFIGVRRLAFCNEIKRMKSLISEIFRYQRDFLFFKIIEEDMVIKMLPQTDETLETGILFGRWPIGPTCRANITLGIFAKSFRGVCYFTFIKHARKISSSLWQKQELLF